MMRAHLPAAAALAGSAIGGLHSGAQGYGHAQRDRLVANVVGHLKKRSDQARTGVNVVLWRNID
jgi:hypothetical protein